MAVKKELRAIISADDRAFQRRMAQVKRTTMDVGRGFVTIGLAGGAAYLALTKHAADYADSLDKASLRLGINTDQLQRMRYAAALAGINQDTFDTSLQRMTRRISEANQGNLGYIRALREIGLNFRDLRNMDAGEQFMQVMKGLAGIANQGDRARLAMQFFDTEGVRLVQLLGNGFQGLVDIIKGVPDDILLTDEQVANGTRLNDNLTIMRAILMGGLRRAVAETFPAMNEAMENINRQILDFIRSDAFQKMAAQSNAMAREMAKLAQDIIPLVKIGFEGLAELNAFLKPIQGARELLGLLVDVAAAMDNLSAASLDNTDSFMAGPNATNDERAREARNRRDAMVKIGNFADRELSGLPSLRRATLTQGLTPVGAPSPIVGTSAEVREIIDNGNRRWNSLMEFLTSGPLGEGR